MAFRPASSPRCQHVDTHPLSYQTRGIRKKSRDGVLGRENFYLYFRVSAALAAKLQFKNGDPIRVDIDEEARLGRLVVVQRSSRHLTQRGTTQWAMRCVFPHTGDLQAHFPAAPKTRGLTIVETSATEGLTFELP